MKRRTLVITLAVVTTGAAWAQPNEILNAYNFMDNGQLDKAKASIDKAATHPKSSLMSKCWFYRGQIYHKIFETQNEEYKKLHANPLVVAGNSYLKMYEFNYKKLSPKEMSYFTKLCGKQLVNKGIGQYNEKAYADALSSFETALKISKHYEELDTITMYSAALAASNGGDKAKAEKYFKACIDNNYKTDGPLVYYHYANMFAESDQARYTEIIKEGRTKYPNDANLLTAEINIYLQNENKDEALKALNAALAQDAQNKTLYQARGSLLQEKGDEAAAEADYKKAIEIDETYFDAHYNLGALYYNQAVEDLKKVNEIPGSKMKEYQAAKEKNNELFKKALPSLEKAETLNPTDKATLGSLKEIYARTGMNEKYEAVKKKLEN